MFFLLFSVLQHKPRQLPRMAVYIFSNLSS